MNTHASLVVGTDGSPESEAAVGWAADAAALYRAPLHIVHVIPPWERPTGEFASLGERAEQRAAEVLGAAETQALEKHPSLRVTKARRDGEIADELLAAGRNAARLVVGGRGRGGFAALLLGSTSRRVAERATVPVVVVRERPDEPRGTIVVGVDGSSHASAALDFAFAEASVRGSAIRAAFVWKQPYAGGFEPGYGLFVETLAQSNRDLVENALAPRRARYPDVRVTGEVFDGHPVSVLSSLAADADLLVVGTRGMGSVRSALLGSVSHGVLHHARCVVAVVPDSSEDDG